MSASACWAELKQKSSVREELIHEFCSKYCLFQCNFSFLGIQLATALLELVCSIHSVQKDHTTWTEERLYVAALYFPFSVLQLQGSPSGMRLF